MKAKLWLWAIAGAALLAAGVANAQRQNPPFDLWCRDQAVADSSTVQICMAYTLQQCLDSRTAPGEIAISIRVTIRAYAGSQPEMRR